MRYISILIINLTILTTLCAQNTFKYDSLGRIKEVVYFDSLRVRYQYDATGNRQNRTVECIRLLQSQRRDTICEGDTLRVAQNRYTQTGNYQDTFRFTTKCDSVVQTNLFVKRIERTRLDTSICGGDSLYVTKNVYTLPNTYRDTFPVFTEGVCFRVQTTQLTVNPLFRRDISICNGGSYNFYGLIARNAGVYAKRFTSVRGCDSLVHLNLSVIVPSRRVFDTTVCHSPPLELGGKLFYAAGIDSVTLRSQTGCDSLKLIVNVRFGNKTMTNISYSICQGDSIRFGNRFLKQAGLYIDTIRPLLRCDSVIRLNLQIIPRPQLLYGIDSATCDKSNGRIWVYDPTTRLNLDGKTDTAFTNLSVGTYPIIVQWGNVCTTRDTVKIAMASPAVKVVVNTNPNGSVTAIGSLGTPSYRFRWSDSLTLTNDTRSRLPRGNFTVTVTDSKGCQDSIRFFYNATHEIEELRDFSISPNPTNGRLNIKGVFETLTPFECQLVAVNGQMIWKHPLSIAKDFHFDINISIQANGEYFFILKSQGRVISYRIVLQH